MAFLNCLEIASLSFKGQCGKRTCRCAGGMRPAGLGSAAHGDNRRHLRALPCPPSSPSSETKPPFRRPPGHGHHTPSVERQEAPWSGATSPLKGSASSQHTYLSSTFWTVPGSTHDPGSQREGRCEKSYFVSHFLADKRGGRGSQGAPGQQTHRPCAAASSPRRNH